MKNSPMDVVFDFGNVLVEWNAPRLLREHFAHALPHQDYDAAAKTFVNAEWIAYDHGEIDAGTLATRLAPRLGCSEHALLEFVQRIPYILPTLDESIAAMRALCDARDQGAPLRVLYLSNMPRDFADTLERRFDWISRFDGGIFSGRNRLSKPDPAIYAALESRYGMRAERTLFLDDSPPNIQSAQTRGWRTVHVQREADVTNGLRTHRLLP